MWGPEKDCPEGLILQTRTPETIQFLTASAQSFDTLVHPLIVSEIYGDCWFSFEVFAEGSEFCRRPFLKQHLPGLYLEYKIPLLKYSTEKTSSDSIASYYADGQ